MPKKVLMALPPTMLEEIDRIATVEHRTRSDLIRESLRRYMQNFNLTYMAPVEVEQPSDFRELVLQR